MRFHHSLLLALGGLVFAGCSSFVLPGVHGGASVRFRYLKVKELR